MPLPPPRVFLAPLFLRYLCPYLHPPSAAERIAQRQQRIDVRFGPVHPRPLHPLLHYQLIRALHTATANRPPLRLEDRLVP
jgi:hypothetical protein